MSRRSGQAGSVFLRHGRYVGRYWQDTPEGRTRKAIVLGLRSELTKSEAKRKLMLMLAQDSINVPTEVEAVRVTFTEAAQEWQAKRLQFLKPSTQYGAPKLIANHLTPFFGRMAIAGIKTGNINEWIAKLTVEGLSPKSIHNAWKLFRAIVNWHAKQNDEQPRHWYPTLPVIPVKEPRWFTPEEVSRIVEAAHGQYKVLFHLAYASGLRSGELLALHVEDIDLGRGIVHVRRSLYKGIEVTPKTVNSFRDVWIDTATVRMIADYLGDRRTGRVFQTRNGTPLCPENVLKTVLIPLCEKLGIPKGGMHSFRHGRVSHLQAQNVPAEFIKAQVGHSSLQMTGRYTHFSDAFAREQVERTAIWTY